MDDENDLDNIFKEYEIDDVRESENEPRNDENSANTETNEGQTRQVVPVPKRVIRNPRLKFNAERLCGERGIPIVTKHFKNVKFKGKGHEKEDLNNLLSTLEHWSHRLFPSMKFEACLKQIEKLGKKRPVQTCLVKIRRNMPILKDDFVHDDEEEERETSMPEAEIEEAPTEDAFDRLFGEVPNTEGPSTVISTPQAKPSSGNVLGSSFGSSLTEEQRKKIEYNKMLATERRRAKMAANSAMAVDNSETQPPSVSDSSFADSSKTSSQTNLEQQFDSLFDEPTTQKVNESHSENNQPADEDVSMDVQDYDETLKLPLNVNQQFDSLFNKPNQEALSSKNCENMNKDYLENNNPTEEDFSMDLQDDDETMKLASSVNKEFESVLDRPSQKALAFESCKKDHSEHRHKTSEDTEMKLQGPCASELVENNYKSSEDIFGSMNYDTENRAEFENNKESIQASCKSVPEDTVKELPLNNKDYEMNSEEPINDTAKGLLSQGESKQNEESETEELELDALMDLVDENFSD